MLFLFQREISELCQLISMKFCTVITSRPNFITPVQNFTGPSPEKYRDQKHAKFGSILDEFKLWW